MLRQRSRSVVLLASMLLPGSLRRLLYVRLFGWQLSRSARIGFSYIDAGHVSMGDGSRIGHFNVVRNVPLLELGEGSSIGQWNWLTSAVEFDSPRPPGGGFRGLRMGLYAGILSRHYLDCAGGITIGDDSALAGVRSTLLTHQVDIQAGTVGTAPIQIGSQCLISSNVSITPGAVIPRRCVVAMGAVVVGPLEEEGALYAGVPARVVRRNITSAGFFRLPRRVYIAAAERRRPSA